MANGNENSMEFLFGFMFLVGFIRVFVRDLWWLWEDYNGYGGGSVIKSPRSVL
jgi:hypothetical protein